MNRLALLLLALLLALGHAQDADPAVLRLGDRTITRSDFDARFQFYSANLAASQNLPFNDQTRAMLEQLRPGYLDQLAAEQLVLALGRELGLSPDESFVESRLAEIRSSFPSQEAYEEALEQAGVGGEERLALYLSEADLSNKTIARLREEAEVPDYLVRLFYDANREEFRQPGEACARHILVETREEALELRADLEGGASFEDLARERSLDPGSASRGGDLGCFPEGVMVPVFEDAAFGTPVGTLSQPIESPYGYHLVLPYERSDATVTPLAEVEARIRQELERQIVRKVVASYRERAGLELFPENVAPQEGN